MREPHAEAGGLAFVWDLRIRWPDFDANGHINNAVFLTYLEEARDQLFVVAGIPRDTTVLARCEVDFRRPVGVGAERLQCTVSCLRLGRSSIATAEVLTAEGIVVLEAASVSVHVGSDGRPCRVPDRARRQLAGRLVDLKPA